MKNAISIAACGWYTCPAVEHRLPVSGGCLALRYERRVCVSVQRGCGPDLTIGSGPSPTSIICLPNPPAKSYLCQTPKGGHTAMIGVISNTILLSAAFALMAGCSTTRTASEGTKILTFETILKRDGGYTEALKERREVLINTPAELQGLWSELHVGEVPQPAPPSVDFSRNSIVAIVLGERTTGGYSVEISSIIMDNGDANVIATERRPGRGCFVSEALTTPAHLVKTAKITGSVAFNVRTLETQCR